MLLAEARYNVVLYILFGGFTLSTTIHAYVVPVETGPEDGTEDDTTWPVTYDKATCVLKLASRCGELSKDCSIMPSSSCAYNWLTEKKCFPVAVIVMINA